MKRMIHFALCMCLFLTVAFVATNADAGDQKPFTVHFVVLSKTMADGTDAGSAFLSFKKEVIQLTGGFTELGPSQGGSIANGVVKGQNNVSFVIGADRDVSVELKAMTKRLFGGDGAFILSWPGKVLF